MKSIEQALKQLQQIHPQDEFIQSLKNELNSRFDKKLQPHTIFQHMLAFVIVLLILSAIGSGVAYAAYQSKPGQLLYPVKHYLEQILPVFPKKEIETSKAMETTDVHPIPTNTPTSSPHPLSSDKSIPTPTIQKPIIISVNVQLPKTTFMAELTPTPIPSVASSPTLQNLKIDGSVQIMLPDSKPLQTTPPSQTPAQTPVFDVKTTVPTIGKIGVKIAL